MHILITGAGSYVGTNVRRILEEAGHTVEEMDVRGNEYETADFSSYDAIFHVAAIVHTKDKAITAEDYDQVNAQLPYRIAKRAKEQGVGHFIFMSTMGVYGEGKKLPNGNVITLDTPLNPENDYGKSKLKAEQLLQELEDDSFVLSIIRPPSIYGLNCPGNYIDTFVKLADKLPVFPNIYQDSKQGFLYIDNLAYLILMMIEERAGGVYLPQDDQVISTVELLSLIAYYRDKSLKLTRVANPFIQVLRRNNLLVKLFGGISYDESLVYFDNQYRKKSLKDAFEFVRVM